ncbi:unnamed protein product [Caretta caretta]
MRLPRRTAGGVRKRWFHLQRLTPLGCCLRARWDGWPAAEPPSFLRSGKRAAAPSARGRLRQGWTREDDETELCF